MSVTKVSSAMSDAQTRNDIINGGYLVNQENDTAAADDDYSIGDLFLHVGEAAVTTSLQTSGGPQGGRNFARINIDTANKQSGWVYFLSNADCQDYIANGKMSFGIKIKTTSAAIDTVRIGLLKWTGTADVITSDVVATWAQDGTNPTLATSWSYENTPADVNLTTDWVRHTVEDVTVDSDTNNLACFVWIDDGTIAEDDQFDVSEWQLNPGSTVNDFSSPPLATVLGQVSWYMAMLGGSGVANARPGISMNAQNTSSSQGSPIFNLRATPTFSFSGTSWKLNPGGDTDTTPTATQLSRNGANFSMDGMSSLVAHEATTLYTPTGADYLLFDARL